MTIRSSASLLLVTPKNRFLFMRRPQHGSYPNSSVFPGGVAEKTDMGLAYTALRETFEETGLLVVPQRDPQLFRIGQHETFEQALESVGVSPAKFNWDEPEQLGLSKISRWVTPKTYKKRFSTQFFVYNVPRAFDLDDVKSDETDLLEWMTPDETLRRFQAGEITLMPPQFYLMKAIQTYGLQGAIDQLKDRVVEPAQIQISDDKKIQHLDWGHGERGIIKRDSAGVIRDIKHVLARQGGVSRL